MQRIRTRAEETARAARRAGEPLPYWGDWRDVYALRAYWEDVLK